jgi:hypothetical protein
LYEALQVELRHEGIHVGIVFTGWPCGSGPHGS